MSNWSLAFWMPLPASRNMKINLDKNTTTRFMFPCIIMQYTKMTNKMQLCRIIDYSLAALHVSTDIFAHHQEHLNCITASGITRVCHCRLVPEGSDIRV